jgi:hypothetical protein
MVSLSVLLRLLYLISGFVEGGIRDAMLSAQILGLRSGLRFLKHFDDLFFCESLPLHPVCSLMSRLYSVPGVIWGSTSPRLKIHLVR